MVSRNEFEAAVKDAFRHYARADLLVANPLLRARVLQQRGPDATGTSLRSLLTESADTLFSNTRDEKLRRVLDLTYFNPAPKQEAAADRLGLSFSTYRRHLNVGVGRVIDWLWQQEQAAPEQTLPAEPDIRLQGTGRGSSSRRLSIVVLPFLNLSHDPHTDYLVDGIVESLMTDLSRALPGSLVISRSTAFTYKSRTVPIRQIGQELGVRYVLEGSVLVDADRIRVNAQLVDAETDEHLWAERFDKERRGLLQMQDEIVARLLHSVGIEMVRKEAKRSSSRDEQSSDAVDLAMRGNALLADLSRRQTAIEAVSLFNQALTVDPDNVDALVGLASARLYALVNQYKTDGREALLEDAQSLIARAMALAPDHIGVLKARAVFLRASGRFMEAIVAAKSVIALNPGEPEAHRELGLNHLYLGATKEAADWFRRADAIAPRDRSRWTWLQGLGRALLQLGQDDQAAEALRLAVDNNPNYARGRPYLVAAETLAGNLEAASLHLSKIAELDPGLTIKCFVEQRSSVPLATVSPIYMRENERILQALRIAGMPEE